DLARFNTAVNAAKQEDNLITYISKNNINGIEGLFEQYRASQITRDLCARIRHDIFLGDVEQELYKTLNYYRNHFRDKLVPTRDVTAIDMEKSDVDFNLHVNIGKLLEWYLINFEAERTTTRSITTNTPSPSDAADDWKSRLDAARQVFDPDSVTDQNRKIKWKDFWIDFNSSIGKPLLLSEGFIPYLNRLCLTAYLPQIIEVMFPPVTTTTKGPELAVLDEGRIQAIGHAMFDVIMEANKEMLKNDTQGQLKGHIENLSNLERDTKVFLECFILASNKEEEGNFALSYVADNLLLRVKQPPFSNYIQVDKKHATLNLFNLLVLLAAGFNNGFITDEYIMNPIVADKSMPEWVVERYASRPLDINVDKETEALRDIMSNEYYRNLGDMNQSEAFVKYFDQYGKRILKAKDSNLYKKALRQFMFIKHVTDACIASKQQKRNAQLPPYSVFCYSAASEIAYGIPKSEMRETLKDEQDIDELIPNEGAWPILCMSTQLEKQQYIVSQLAAQMSKKNFGADDLLKVVALEKSTDDIETHKWTLNLTLVIPALATYIQEHPTGPLEHFDIPPLVEQEEQDSDDKDDAENIKRAEAALDILDNSVYYKNLASLTEMDAFKKFADDYG